MIIEMSMSIIALAFVVLTIYLISMSKAVQKTLDELNRTLIESRIHLRELSQNSGKTMDKVETIGVDLKQKMETLNPIFNSISNLGKIFESQSSAMKQRYLKQSLNDYGAEELSIPNDSKPSSLSSGISEAIEFASLGVSLWQKLKKKGRK